MKRRWLERKVVFLPCAPAVHSMKGLLGENRVRLQTTYALYAL